jgi:hypothetical protein
LPTGADASQWPLFSGILLRLKGLTDGGAALAAAVVTEAQVVPALQAASLAVAANVASHGSNNPGDPDDAADQRSHSRDIEDDPHRFQRSIWGPGNGKDQLHDD